MKIVSEKAPEVLINEMKDGDIAIITRFQGRTGYRVGQIGQRYGKSFVFLGVESGHCLDILFTAQHDDIFVRILPAGTVIEI